jgi:two-component system phosphate regulon sensor histidine kinase PhoR
MAEYGTDKGLAEILKVGIVIVDPKANRLWWNNLAEQLLGKAVSDPKTDTATLLRLSHFNPVHAAKQNKTIFTKSTTLREQHLSVETRAYGDHNFVIVVNNITPKVRVEQMRRDFVANISHELRTPLTVVRGYLELLQEYSDFENEQTDMVLKQMNEHTLRMQHLVEDLLTLSRLESDKSVTAEKQSVDVPKLLLDIKQQATVLSGERNHEIELVVDENIQLLGSEKELHSAFSNLVYNAINYTPAGGKIKITWAMEGQQPCLHVQDTGIGIASEHIPRLTERFYRVDKARAGTSGGTGLGLAITKHVLLRHEAELRIESELGKGSTFTCCFPQNRMHRLLTMPA